MSGLALATLLALLLPLAACGDDGGRSATGGPASAAPADGGAAPGSTAKAQAPRPLDPALAGRVTGVITVSGPVPSRPPLTVTGEAWCTARHPGGRVQDASVRVQDGRLAGAFVWIADDLSAWDLPVPSTPVVLDQRSCLFEPRVVGVALGQELVVRNGDEVMHNVHTHPEANRAQNFGMPAGSQPRALRLRRPEVMIEVVCDVHAWMRAWIGVLPHPCFAVTGDDGAFTIEGVPPGEHLLGVWHEVLGERRVPVVVPEGGEAAMGEVALGP
jgi:hypothetical protein